MPFLFLHALLAVMGLLRPSGIARTLQRIAGAVAVTRAHMRWARMCFGNLEHSFD
ncbi:hypothetical protein [Rhodococcus opacus]|uniref:hypothetical protein n=1 Tax=Rhodococcus opacus TaxID=37919 RepID=UPI0016512B78|nr:hypothetical protein [Rhodococcus opacus]